MKTAIENKIIDSEEKLRDILNFILVERIKSNSRYSLRAFAQSLEIDAGQLSRFFSGKRTFSKATTIKIVSKLPLNLPHIKKIIEGGPDNSRFLKIELDQFEIISEWHHYAILELTRVEGFLSEVSWIANKLNISQAETKNAIERLLRLGYLVENEDGNWVDVSGNISTFHHPSTNTALKEQQKQILKNAITAVEHVEYSKRDQSALTFAISTNLIPEVKKRIEQFRAEIDLLVESSLQPRDEVYQFSLSFFPVTNVINKNIKKSREV